MATVADGPAVGVRLLRYLPPSQTFIYEELRQAKRFRRVILANHLEAERSFPLPDVYVPYEARFSGSYWRHLTDTRLLGMLAHERVARRTNVRLLHAHFGGLGVQSLPLKRRLGLPLITTFHGYDMSRYAWLEQFRIEYQELFAEGDLFLVEGPHMKKCLVDLGCPADKVTVHHIGIDLSKFTFRPRAPKPDGTVVVLFVGRFTEKKGLLYALRALGALARKGKDFEFRVIGDGDEVGRIREEIERQGLNCRVKLLGAKNASEVIEEMGRAHIFLSPSITASDGDSEGGAPTTLLEAQATGMPVVSTLHADIPYVVKDQTSGFLVPERDVDHLVERLDFLMGNPDVWATMGSAGRDHIGANHDSVKIAEELEAVYAGSLGS